MGLRVYPGRVLEGDQGLPLRRCGDGRDGCVRQLIECWRIGAPVSGMTY
jgi:hypothetical protein